MSDLHYWCRIWKSIAAALLLITSIGCDDDVEIGDSCDPQEESRCFPTDGESYLWCEDDGRWAEENDSDCDCNGNQLACD